MHLHHTLQWHIEFLNRCEPNRARVFPPIQREIDKGLRERKPWFIGVLLIPAVVVTAMSSSILLLLFLLMDFHLPIVLREFKFALPILELEIPNPLSIVLHLLLRVPVGNPLIMLV